MRKTIILSLSFLGLIISSYLTYTKFTSQNLICGKSNGCAVVQNSKYSTLLGIPLGIWGIAYYLMLLAIYAADYFNLNSKIKMALKREHIKSNWILWGILFSAYLAILEAFVIHAFCLWCLGSFFIIIIIGILHFTNFGGNHSKAKNDFQKKNTQ